MDTTQLIKHILSKSGKTSTDVSRVMDRSDGYLRQVMHRGSAPTLPVFIEIAKACGYKLCLIKDDDTIVIDELAYDKH
ncbi:hypothetical protein [Atopobium fossor]|uniref:hypothetical protein n=1 Tax=Atopobium fossor TaxID=39487 RepID=UPI00048642D9|nr:hypothetical protein [Atopobium fossor]